jgi:SAM-dependent methyltransferase
MADATQRFTDRVSDYVAARPTYPPEVLDLLQRRIGFDPKWTIADIGSGTGISSRLFLGNGNRVFCVEPNAAMRTAAEASLKIFPGFNSIDAAAERTALPDAAIDLVVAAQAFHWFDRDAFAAECRRILKPNGYLLLMWNDRFAKGSPFVQAYEKLLHDHGTDYVKVNHRNISDAQLQQIFAPRSFCYEELANEQQLNFDLLRSRLASSSFMPKSDDPRFAEIVLELRRIFDAHQSAGIVTMLYRTQLYMGRLA